MLQFWQKIAKTEGRRCIHFLDNAGKSFLQDTMLQHQQSVPCGCLSQIIRKCWDRLISTSQIFLSILYNYVVNCWGAPLFCKIYEVHVQLKDYDWGLIRKEVMKSASHSRNFWKCLIFLLPFVLPLDLRFMGLTSRHITSAVNVHYDAKRPYGKLLENILYRIKISIFLKAFIMFL